MSIINFKFGRSIICDNINFNDMIINIDENNELHSIYFPDDHKKNCNIEELKKLANDLIKIHFKNKYKNNQILKIDNLDDFLILFRLGKINVICDTKFEANEFLSVLHFKGFEWNGGDSLLNKNNWDENKDKTCYSFKSYGVVYSDYKCVYIEDDEIFINYKFV